MRQHLRSQEVVKLCSIKHIKAGPESEGGGVFDDANNEFVYQIVIPSTTTNCLTFNIADAYGDGLIKDLIHHKHPKNPEL